MNYGQKQYDSGYVEYGVELNDEFLKKIKRVSQQKEKFKTAFKYMKKFMYNHKKIYSSDITFLKLTFSDGTYLLKPEEIMLPENLQGKFIFQSSIYYGDINSNVYLNQFDKRSNTYIAPFNENFNWEIKDQQKNILGFPCRKAIIEKKLHSKKLNITNTLRIVAWFTPQIPVAFSPVKYYGLPVTTPMKHIYAKNIEFKNDVKIENPTDGIQLSAEEYKKLMGGFNRPD
jgi:GLPGLI family protein